MVSYHYLHYIHPVLLGVLVLYLPVNSEVLMSKNRTHTKYVDDMYQPLPSVTTILSIISKPALVHSAWKLGTQGIDYKKHWGQKADIGTLTHSMILAHLNDKQSDTRQYSPEDVDQAENCFLKYLEWEKRNPFEIVLCENPMVSLKHRYGGTPDLVCKLNGKNTLIDFKSGNDIYPEMAYQLAAYDTMLMENDVPVEQWMILRIGRDETEGFEVKQFTDIEPYWFVFEAALKLHWAIEKTGGRR